MLRNHKDPWHLVLWTMQAPAKLLWSMPHELRCAAAGHGTSTPSISCDWKLVAWFSWWCMPTVRSYGPGPWHVFTIDLYIGGTFT